MPLYEYQCEKCGSVFEALQKFSDAPLTSHQVCGGPVHRLLSTQAFQFKGTGWYVTDYGKGGSRPSNGNGTKHEDKPTAKAESKPAASKPEATKA